MRFYLRTVVVLVLMLNLGNCGPATERPEPEVTISPEADVLEIETVSKRRADAFNASDASAIASHFTDDAVLMAPGAPAAIGRQAVEAYYQSIFDAFIPALTSSYQEVEVSGDLAFGRGSARVKLIPKAGGDPIESSAKYINLLKRQPDGAWKTTHDIWNCNDPSPTTSKGEGF